MHTETGRTGIIPHCKLTNCTIDLACRLQHGSISQKNSSLSYPYPTKWGRYHNFFNHAVNRFGNYFYDQPPA
jgi:hypothetical protein